MGGDVERIKERLDIVEVTTPYLKLEKSGANFKARCPFHNEKTASLFISPLRQTYYCFGCGAKGDIFSFIQEIEGVDFRESLKILANKAGVELEHLGPKEKKLRTERDKLLSVVEGASEYFEKNLHSNEEAKSYLASRGIKEDSLSEWHIGYAKDEWRNLYDHLLSVGFSKEMIVKAGLAKIPEGKEEKPPYDVFRGRIVFPLNDSSGKTVGFSGRALKKDLEPKYLNSPDTVLFTKSELLFGLDKAKEDIRKKNYAILVEGQLDLILSHQSGIRNTVASSGTAFTSSHLERLKKLSPRIILAFDGDNAGRKAAEKSSILAMGLGMEVKIAKTPKGKDPADCIVEDAKSWKDVLRESKHAIEHLLDLEIEEERDSRKLGKTIEKKILPLILLLSSSIERSHFVALISKKTGLKESVLWDDLRRAKLPDFEVREETTISAKDSQDKDKDIYERLPRKTAIERRICGIIYWQESLTKESMPVVDVASLKSELVDRVGQKYFEDLYKSLEIDKEALVFEAESYYKNSDLLTQEVTELLSNLSEDMARERLSKLIIELARAEASKDESQIESLSGDIAKIHSEIISLEEKRKMM